MQAYHNGEPPYYPSQYAQPQATYYGSYTAYHPYLPPPQQNVAAPFPTYAASYDTQAQYPTPAPPRRKLGRTASSTTTASVNSRPSTPAAPLRSAMKKRKSFERSISLSRQRSQRSAASESRQRVNSLTGPRANSLPALVPDHLFLSLHGTNEIRMDSIAYQETLDDLRESILPMWPQGVAAEESKRDYWRVRFGGSPWTCVGADAILAQRLVCRLFVVLARQGYSYLTTVQTACAPRPPRLIFVNGAADPDAHVFMAMFSRSKMRLSLLDAPPDAAEQLAQTLRPLFPRKVQSFGANEDGVHIIEVKRDGLRSREMSKNIFHACMLREFNHLGYKLDGSVQLGKKGPLGFGSRREAWIFRSIIRRQEVRLKE